MISTAETEPFLEAALADAGFRHDAPDARRAWAAFRDFATVPVSVAEDAFLFQCGVRSDTGEERFHWRLTRQFTHEAGSGDEGMEQLSLTLLYEPTPELRALQATLRSDDRASLAGWFARVEALPEFQAVLGLTPTGCELVQHEA